MCQNSTHRDMVVVNGSCLSGVSLTAERDSYFFLAAG